MQVVINDQIVNYTISGNGKKLLILHGWGDSIASYPNLIKELSNNDGEMEDLVEQKYLQIIILFPSTLALLKIS